MKIGITQLSAVIATLEVIEVKGVNDDTCQRENHQINVRCTMSLSTVNYQLSTLISNL